MKERKLFSLKPVRFGKRRQVVFVLLLTLFGFSNVWADNSSNGWSFTVKGDGTAMLEKPIREIWEMSEFKGYADSIPTNLTFPSQVTAKTITWNSTAGYYEPEFRLRKIKKRLHS